MEAELEAARRRIQILEAQVLQVLADAEKVRSDARNLSRVQQQLQQELFQMHRRVDFYTPSATATPPYSPHEILQLDMAQIV
jgi:hypothetical protein